MPDKSTSSERPAATTEVPESAAPARKLYPVVKYGDPVLEKPAAAIKKFDADLEQLAEDMFASMYAAQGVGLAAPHRQPRHQGAGPGRLRALRLVRCASRRGRR